MALNTWWDDEPDERYWLEITDRSDLGADLLAPQVDDAGRPYWSYNLVTEVRQGDVVLHWHKSLVAVPAIVGWSLASGVPACGLGCLGGCARSPGRIPDQSATRSIESSR